jgi:hypothetical protein
MIDGLLFASCLHCALNKSLAVRFCLRLMGLPPCPSWANFGFAAYDYRNCISTADGSFAAPI